MHAAKVAIDGLNPLARLVVGGLAALLLAGCGSVFYARTATGTFAGKLTVEWIAPNQFIYRPDKDAPLRFTRADGTVIQPQPMYTDGGSIPRLFWSAPDLGPWDFAPAYIVHDWLFQQHHCRLDDWERFDVDLAAQVLAEGIKTQMQGEAKAEPAIAYAVYEAVRTPMARRLWEQGKCLTPPSVLAAPPAAGAGAPVVILRVDVR